MPAHDQEVIAYKEGDLVVVQHVCMGRERETASAQEVIDTKREGEGTV